MSHTLINCTCKNRVWYHSILRGSTDPKHAKTNEIWRQNSEIHSAFACSPWPPWFPYLSRPYGACVKCESGKDIKETYVRSQSSSESVVKYLHVGRRNIQTSPPLGEQGQSNAIPQGQQRQSNPHSMPCLPPSPAGMTLIGALPDGKVPSKIHFYLSLACAV